jgi:predicted GNAT family acetyltransferase
MALQSAPARLSAQLVSSSDRELVLSHLKQAALQNLLLLDLVARVGLSSPTEFTPQVLAAWRDGRPIGVASLRPSLVLDSAVDLDVLEILMPYFESIETGLVKSGSRIVSALWSRLSALGRFAQLDRAEIAYALHGDDEALTDPPVGCRLRRAVDKDVDELVVAARASLREEGRPDPFVGDPTGFRRWVRGRMHRARLIEADGRIAFVGYADVRRPEGWLIQGVYTWPALRRRGLARAGMSGLIREAFSAGADHVQLAVVEGNTAGFELYESLGFRPFAELRTVLFS